MPTSIQLTQTEIQDLKTLRAQAEALGAAVGAWSTFYDYLTAAGEAANDGEFVQRSAA